MTLLISVACLLFTAQLKVSGVASNQEEDEWTNDFIVSR